MAENEDGQERTESATPKRLEEARRRGQIPCSRDLSTAAVMMTAGAGLYFFGAQLSGNLHGLMRRGLTLSRDQSLDPNQIVPVLSATAADALLACVPLFGLIVLAALLAPLALGKRKDGGMVAAE